jgi:ribosomal protein L32
MALERCDNCGHEVPASRFCIRCGNRLDGEEPALSGIARIPGGSVLGKGMSGVLSLDPSSLSGVRRAFAAAPEESVLRPTIVSTIFPQLPHSSMRAFRSCLALGLAAVLILGIAKLYPVALIASAVMLPTLVIIYMFDVNVFEDTSLSFVLGTVGWGLATGVITALIAKAISPNGTDVFTGAHGSLVLVRGLLIPVVSAVLILAGPTALMRLPQFSTVLDGVTFAAASAATFIGAEAIIQAISALGDGLRPPGSVVPWLVQLAIIAIALPLVTIGAMSAAAAALWLKYRAPIRDRSALGRLGRPGLAIPLGVAALILAALVQLETAPGIALILMGAIAALGMLWLRQVIHVGLLEEALEIEDAPVIVCANCDHRTRKGRFCEYCGIALAALPTSRSGVQRTVSHDHPHDHAHPHDHEDEHYDDTGQQDTDEHDAVQESDP